MSKLRRALARGKNCSFWFFADDCFILRHPGGGERAEIPAAHLRDDAMMFEHYSRLSTKNWVTPAAIDELRLIAEGANR